LKTTKSSHSNSSTLGMSRCGDKDVCLSQSQQLQAFYQQKLAQQPLNSCSRALPSL
jgi:hypothetical protein